MSNQQLARKEQVKSVREALEKLKPQMAMALPKHLTPERMLRVVMSAVQNNPRLLDCDRTSLFASVMTAAQLGLETDGVLGQAYLVPFKNRVQFIPGYKGYLALARNSGEVTSIQAHEVCEKDDFQYAYGLSETLHHVPAGGDRGAITHFYAYAKFTDGGHIFEVLTRADVDAVRDNSEGFRAFKANRIKSNPWDSHYIQMGRKTAIRRLANYLPLNVQRAAALDSAYDAGRHASADDFGDIVIDGESTEITETEGASENKADSKMGALAGDQPEGESKAATKKASKKKSKKKASKKTSKKSAGKKDRFKLTDDADVIDTESGEVVPDEFIVRHDDGTFSVSDDYFGDDSDDEGLFGDD